MPKYTDRPDTKAGLQIFKYSEEMDPGFYVYLTKAKASVLKNVFEEFKTDLIHVQITKLYYFYLCSKTLS